MSDFLLPSELTAMAAASKVGWRRYFECWQACPFFGVSFHSARSFTMKKIVMFLALSCIVAPAFAEKDCEELKTEIAAKLDAKGVVNYTLAIVATEEVTELKVVGTCAGGAKKITYTRG
jgi:hypothetical protein